VAESDPLAAITVLPEPEDELHFGEVEFYLYARRGERLDSDAWDGHTLQILPGQTVGALADSVASALAKERGWAVEGAPTLESAYRKLLAGRTRYLLAHGYFVDAMLEAQAGAGPGLFRLKPAVSSDYLQVAATRDFYRREPVFTQRFWVEMCLQSNAMRAVPQKCQLPVAR